MESGVEKVDSGAGGSQHRRVGRPRQLRACVGLVLVAVLAAAPLPLAAQQEQRVVRGLSFDGNKAIDDYTLSTAIATSNSSFFASVWWLRWIGFLGEKRYFNELEFRRDVVRLLLLYRQSGYMSAVIDTLVRREGNDVFIRVRTMAGDPVRLERLETTGLDDILSVPALKKDLPLAVGTPFNRMLFQASADTIVGRLKNRGYPYADVLRSFDVNAAELRAVATLEAVPGPRMRIGDVAIGGTEKVDTGTVRRMLSVKRNDLFRQDRLYQTQRDLYGTGLFRSVNVVLADTAPPADPGDSTVGVVLRQPFFLSPRHAASFGVFAERRSEFKAYTRQAVGGNLAVTLNARRNIPVTVGYGFSYGRTTAQPAVFCSVFRVCDAGDRALLESSRRFAAVTVSGVRDQVNNVLDPSGGSLVTVTVMHASRLVYSDTLYEFNRGELEASRYYPLGRRGVFAWRVRAGAIVLGRITLAGQSVHFVPPDQRFYGGGPNSVRGYARNELGPRVYVTDSIDVGGGGDSTFLHLTASPTGGNTIFVANTEVRFATPLFPDRMRVALFVDAGQVWERGEPLTTVNGLRVTPGVGLRFATPLGPVRLDAAYNGYPAEAGPVYLLNNTDKSLTLIPGAPFRPALPSGFWRRIVWQFAVGQAF